MRRVCSGRSVGGQLVVRRRATALRLSARTNTAVRPRVPASQTCVVECSVTPFSSEDKEVPTFDARLTVPTTGMAKNLGSSGGAATLQRSKLDMARQVQVVQPRTDNTGGGGGIGNKSGIGGGGGGDDDDDDDYFAEGGDEGPDDGKDPFWRKALPELYDKLSVDAVLAEWFRSVADLPVIIRDLAALGVLSSAQIVGLLRLDGRPNLVRTVCRRLPQQAARNYVGRMMADPGFSHKLMFETSFTFLTSLWYEMRLRKERFSQELDLALANCLSLSIATGLAVWAVAPNKSRGALSRAPWQELLKKAPNNVFEASNPINGPYSMGMRVGSFFKGAVELCGIYGVAGAAGAAVGHGLSAARQMQDPDNKPSVAVPGPAESLGKLGCFGLLQNVRYQALAGVDRGLRDNCNRAWFWKAAPIPLRILPFAILEGWLPCPDLLRRQWYQGLPTHIEPTPQLQVVAAAPPVVKKPAKKRRKSSAGFEVTLAPPPPPSLALQPAV